MTEVIRHLVGDAWTEGTGSRIERRNPSRPSELVAEGNGATGAELDRAVAAARSAQDPWRRTPARERAGVLLRAAEIIASHQEDWGAELSREEGKPLMEATAEVAQAAKILRFHAHEVDRATGEVYESPTPGERILVVRRPVGVIGAITPFNFPISIPAWKLAPVLVWGDTVVWKPATAVPVLAMRFCSALEDAGLPPGVLNLVNGAPELGAELTRHPGIDAITFTGSTRVGRTIAAELGGRGIPLQAELGGKNAALVLADADLELAAHQVAFGAFRSAGQKCTATSRVIVEDAVADEFLERLVVHTEAMPVGDAADPATEVGPVVAADARDRVTAALGRAFGSSATAILAPEPYDSGPLAEGWFVPPSIYELDRRDPGELWTEELFGPVVGVRRAASADEGFQLAADSDHGLSAALFTRDLGAALAGIDELPVGVVHVNSASSGADLHVPFGGIRASGLGPREQGTVARDFVTELTTVYLRG